MLNDLRDTQTRTTGLGGNATSIGTARAPLAPAGPPSGANIAPTEDDAISLAIKQFYEHLMSPLDMNDPYTHAVYTAAANGAANDARLRGVGGPMSVANSEGATTRAMVDLDMKRKEMASGVLGLRSGRNLGLGQLGLSRDQLSENMYQFDQRMAYDAAQAARENDPAQSWGAIGGTLLGAASNLIPGVGPVIAPILTPALASAGAGLAGTVAGRPAPTYTPSRGLGGR